MYMQYYSLLILFSLISLQAHAANSKETPHYTYEAKPSKLANLYQNIHACVDIRALFVQKSVQSYVKPMKFE